MFLLRKITITVDISIHALLAESDIRKRQVIPIIQISIHALLAESDVTVLGIQHRAGISIHALLAESDWWLRCWQLAARDISIHALLAESDGGSVAGNWRLAIFLSTLSLRRATHQSRAVSHQKANFYPRSPCGERLRVLDGSKSSIEISIHALLAESDNQPDKSNKLAGYFYPRSPCGERPSCFGRL